MMMMKSLFAKVARAPARSGRNFSSGAGGPPLPSQLSPPNDNSGIKKIVPFLREVFVLGTKTVCGASGVATGFAFGAAVVPNHSVPLIEEQEVIMCFNEMTQESIIKNDEKLRKLEEEEEGI